jgi:hypothetical protein
LISGEEPIVAIATAPASAPETLFLPKSREIAEDRWEGLMLDRVNADEPSKLAFRLIAIIKELMGGMGRIPMDPQPEIADLEDVITEWVTQWAIAGGVSPTVGREVTFGYVSPFPEDRAAATAADPEYVSVDMEERDGNTDLGVAVQP